MSYLYRVGDNQTKYVLVVLVCKEGGAGQAGVVTSEPPVQRHLANSFTFSSRKKLAWILASLV